jgi:3-hydroxyacyl-CoA dehydrogenase
MARLEKGASPLRLSPPIHRIIPIHDIGQVGWNRQHFLGTHFFNPPRYLKLLEIIPHSDTLPEVLDTIIRFGEDVVGKGIVIAKDTPNFIGNRFFSLAGAYELGYIMEHGYTVEEIDSIAGPLIGRPKSGVFRLLDLVGLDVMAHVNTNLYDAVAGDESRELLRNDRFRSIVERMVQNGWLGNKTGQGFYKSVKQNGQREFWPLNLETLEYQPPTKVRFDSVGKHRKVEPTGARIKALIGETDRAAEFIRHATFHRLSYASRRIPEIADTIVAVDRAVKWGFMEEMGPFEMWDALGVRETVPQMENRFEVAPGPRMLDAKCDCFYSHADTSRQRMIHRPNLHPI